MKKIFRPAAIFVAVLLVAGILGSCAKKTNILLPDGDDYVCRQNGVTYRMVDDIRFEAVNIGEQYGELHAGTRVIPLYCVEGLSPKEWLVTDSGTLYHAATVRFPPAEELRFDALSVCRTKALTLPIATVTDKTVVEAVTDALFHGEVPQLTVIGSSESWRLKFESSEWSGICFSIILSYYENGLKAYDKLSDEQAAAVEKALADAEAALTDEEREAGVVPVPELPDNYEPLTRDKRVKITLEKYTYTASDGTEAVEWDVIYDYGKYFISDRETGRPVPVWDLLAPYVGGNESETETKPDTGTESETESN